MRRAELGQIKLAAQPHQRGLRDMRSARHGGQEVRLIHHDDVVVAVEHRNVEGHHDFVGKVAVVVHERAGRHLGARIQHHTVGAENLAGNHLGHRGRAEPPTELVRDVAALQPQPRRTEHVADHVKGTVSRISARASGAAIRNASAEASSGWVCERTSASTRAI